MKLPPPHPSARRAMGSVFAHVRSAAAAQLLPEQPRKDPTVQQAVDGFIFNRNLSELIRNQPRGLQSHSPVLSFTRLPALGGLALGSLHPAAAAGAHGAGWVSWGRWRGLLQQDGDRQLPKAPTPVPELLQQLLGPSDPCGWCPQDRCSHPRP